MIRETVNPLKADVHRACSALDISQNEFARRAGIDVSVLSRVLNNLMTSDPAEKKIRRYLARVRRRLETVEPAAAVN